MQSKIDLCCMALLKLGEQPIQSLTDDRPAAQLARTLFDSVINTLLASHPWRFAQCKAELIKNSDGNFVIPADCLRIIKCNGELIGDTIIAPTDSVQITYIKKTDVASFPNYFAALAATKLAMEFCIPLLADQNVFRMLAALYESEMQNAKFIDSTTTESKNNINSFSLINTRF